MDEKVLWMNYEILLLCSMLHVLCHGNSHHNSKYSFCLDIYHGSNMVFSPNKQKMLIKSCFDPAVHTVTYKRLTASVI